jgi:hypothetical protein
LILFNAQRAIDLLQPSSLIPFNARRAIIINMANQEDPAVTRITVILKSQSDWYKWLFVLKDKAEQRGVWKYCDPDLDTVPALVEPERPLLTSYNEDAVRMADLSSSDRISYGAELADYQEEKKDYKELLRGLLEINSEISKTIASTNLYLIQKQDGPWNRLKVLKKHLAPTDASRRFDLIAKYKQLQSPSRGKKPAEWLRNWVEVTNECEDISLPDVATPRAQEDFARACHVYDPEYSASSLREIMRFQRIGTPIPSIQDYVAEFESYLKIAKPSTAIGINAMAAAQLTAANTGNGNGNGRRPPKPCLCGRTHWWTDCFALNPMAKNRPSNYTIKPEVKRRIEEALAANPALKGRIDAAIKRSTERVRQQTLSSPPTTQFSVDDGTRPSEPATHTVYTIDRAEPTTHTVYTIDDKTEPTGNLVALTGDQDAIRNGRLSNRWILDPGSNTHVINTDTWIGWKREYEAKDTEYVGAGTGSVKVKAWGSMTLMIRTPHDSMMEIQMTHVALVPGFITSVIGLGRCRAVDIHFDSGRDVLYHKDHGNVLARLEYSNGHWLADADASRRPGITLSSLATSYRKSYEPKPIQRVSSRVAHLIWGHPGQKAIAHLEDAVEGIVIDRSDDQNPCEVCIETKLTKQISRRQQEDYATKPFERLSIDIVQLQPTGEECLNGDKYGGHSVDQYTKWHEAETFPSRSKPVVHRWVMRTLRKIQRQFEYDVIKIRTDGERGFGVSPNLFKEACNDLGIVYEERAPYTDEQNGGAERAGAMLIARARALRLQANLPKSLSNELFRTAAYILNRTPLECLNWRTSYELVWGRKAQGAHMYPIGCKAYVLNHHLRKADKLESRALIGHLVGYDSTNIYRIWLPTKDQVIRTRDVVFDSTSFYKDLEGYARESVIEEIVELLDIPDIQHPEEIGVDNLLTLRQLSMAVPTAPAAPTDTQVGGEAIEKDLEIHGGLLSPAPTERNNSDPALVERNSNNPAESSAQEAQPTTSLSRELSATEIPDYIPDRYNNNAPRARNLELDESNIISGGRSSRSRRPPTNPYQQAHPLFYTNVDNGLYSYLYTLVTTMRQNPEYKVHQSQLPEPPQFYQQLNSHPYGDQFRAAANTEYRSVWAKGCFAKTSLRDAEADAEVLPLMWVFTYKIDADGYLSKFKARIVIRGDLQQLYGDTYAATLAARSFRALLTIANQFGLELKQYDIPTAFLNAKLEKRTYVTTPDGFKHDGDILEVLRALYGLKEAPLLWYNEFKRTLNQLGLHGVEGFPCIYVNDWLILFVYVDDVVMAYHPRNAERHKQFEIALLDCYDIKKLGDLKWYLGIRVLRDMEKRQIWLVQDAYIDKVAGEFDITSGSRPTEVPMTTNQVEASTEEPNEARTKRYQRLVGHLAYLVQQTRPDLARTHSLLASHLMNPGQQHLALIERAWRYIIETKYLALQGTAVQHGKAIEYNTTDGETIDQSGTTSNFLGAADAAFADDVHTRRSSQGYLFQLFSMTVDWKSTYQRTVTKSTTEAELLALSLAGSEMAEWLRLFRGLGLELNEVPIIWCDNQQTVGIATKREEKLNTKLKHVDTHQSWIRQEVSHGRLTVQWIPTADMPADGLTKILPKQKHIQFVRQLGLVDIKRLIK